MAKQKLIPKVEDDEREPHQRFSELAAKVVTVPKPEIDAREERWRKQRLHLQNKP